MATKFKLIRPCAKCPFRTDVPGYLRRERAQEIAESVANGAEFPCHETTVDDGDDNLIAGENSQFCAGALITMEKAGGANQHMRIAERLGVYDAERLDMEAPVYGSLHEFVNHHGDGEEPECCSVVNVDCEAPAGLLVGGFVVAAEVTGEVHECPTCGEPVCGACSVADGRCYYCSENDG